MVMRTIARRRADAGEPPHRARRSAALERLAEESGERDRERGRAGLSKVMKLANTKMTGKHASVIAPIVAAAR